MDGVTLQLQLAIQPGFWATIFITLWTLTEPLGDIIIGQKTMSLNRRVVLHVGAPLEIGELRSIVFYVLNFQPFTVQLWKETDDPHVFTLEWAKEIDTSQFTYFGQYVVNLEEDEVVYDITSRHRLGLYNLHDPNSVLYAIISAPFLTFSTERYPDAPRLGQSAEFGDLLFPYLFSVAFCNHTDCTDVPFTPPPSTAGTPQPNVGTTTTTVAPQPVVTEESLFLNDNFLLGMLVWLGLLSFILFTVVLVMCCVRLQASTKGGDAGPENDDFFIVMDDAAQASTLHKQLTPAQQAAVMAQSPGPAQGRHV